jgi:hypothetical protein
MKRSTALLLASGAMAAAVASRRVEDLRALKAHIPGDVPEDHEDNTFGLPDGAPIRKKMRAFFQDQLKQIVGEVPTLGRPLDDPLPRFSSWTEPMASAMTPLLGVYWDRAGKSLRSRIGLDPTDWRVTDPNVHRAIQDQAIRFCRKTNATTDLGIAEARDAVREQIARGLIGEGETVDQLTNRIRGIFTRASKSRAEMIGRTEASRAIHEATIQSARQSRVVGRKHWLLSANACPYCKAIAAEHPEGISLDSQFGVRGNDPDYSSIHYPPLHPNCRCSMTFELIDEPDQPQPEKAKKEESASDRSGQSSGSGSGSGGGSRFAGGVAKAGRRVAAYVAVGAAVPVARLTIQQAVRIQRKRVAREFESRVIGGHGLQPATPNDKPLLHRVAEPIPKGPIQDRIKAYMDGAGKMKLERLANLDADYDRDLAAVEKARTEALKSLDTLRRRKGYSAEETMAVDAKVQELTDRRDAYKDSLRRNAFRVAEAIAIPTAERALISTRMVTKGRAVPLVSREAEGWLGQVLAQDDLNPKGIKVEYGALKGANARAYYSDKNRRVNLSGAEPTSTIVHEFGHAIEHQWPEIAARSAEFLDYRVSGEQLRSLRSLFPKRNYDASERGRKDRFGQAFDKDAVEAWYCGKEYRHNPRKPDTRYATEILSMGLEKLITDPVKFAKKDPEFCAYILGILDGSLR